MRNTLNRQSPLPKPARKLVAASAITIMLAGVGANAAASTSQELSEARQEAQVETTYALSPYLRAHDIKVSVKDGKATISGIVDEDVNKDLAQQIALGVSGIKSVDNQLEVKADHVPQRTSKERSYGEMIDDATTTAGVKSKLLWSRHASGLNTKVETERGRVTLQGTADSAEAKALAGMLANNTNGVIAVDNQIRVEKPEPGAAEKAKQAGSEAGNKVEDTWITTKVKSTLMYSSNVRGADVEVSTSNGVVTLKGKVATGAERDLAIELAKNVRGVESVNAGALTN